MYLKKIIKYIIIFLPVCFFFAAAAQPLSYIYIQGDKQIPFYVKMEDQMQPRYGKNYCIISQLAPGPINIQILFQQNIYPPQNFTIVVPEGGYRGFLLMHTGTGFSLYDIQQQFYLQSGNTADDDHVPAKTNTEYISKDTIAETSSNDTLKPEDTTSSEPVAQTPPAPENKNDQTANGSGQPQFIGNIELKSDHTKDNSYVATNPDLANDVSANKPAVTNSDCPKPMDINSFNELYKRVMEKSDKNRLKYLLGKLDYCYTSSEIRLLARSLTNDPERYAFLKQAFPRVTDQSNFAALESLLSTQEWKGYFRLIMP